MRQPTMRTRRFFEAGRVIIDGFPAERTFHGTTRRDKLTKMKRMIWKRMIESCGLALLSAQIAAGSPLDPPSPGERQQGVVDGGTTSAAGTADSVSRNSSRVVTRTELSAEDRAAALRFVAEHHPELSHLLMQLKKSRPVEFERAVRELVQQTQVIQRLQEKNPARYDMQLKAWKLDSQIRVLMARWARTADAGLELEIRGLIAERQRMKASQLSADRAKLEEQLKRMDEQLATFSEAEEVRVAAEWEQLSRRAKAASQPPNAAGRPGKTTQGASKTAPGRAASGEAADAVPPVTDVPPSS